MIQVKRIGWSCSSPAPMSMGEQRQSPRHWQTMPHHSCSHAYDFTHTYAYDTETYADSSTSPYPGTATWIAQCQAL